MPKSIESLADLLPDSRNANRGTPRGSELIDQSLRSCGAGRSVLADRNGKLIAGNKTVAGAARSGLSGVIVVPTDGTKLVVVQRTDLDLDHDKAARELALLDNRAGQVSLDWDSAELQRTATDYHIDLDAVGFSAEEMAALLKGSFDLPTDVDAAEPTLKETFGVLVECEDEDAQRELYERLTAEGHSCRLSML